ncbi:uracil-DNA glycosylase [Calidithermus roseus]|uniref:Uracil-DNA glycosylase family domain protein n=1 Tax=Calidithermus roseus TaxID=1644118 RepID=A0A399F275_9DEIN|nr:uracil-DNA glycosylase family protein [Calidithermus roseus]RIH88942.1 uracil-DNA glycosylase family domain protein [Calidithermus roseus]
MDSLEQLNQRLRESVRCEGGYAPVPGEGNPHSPVVLIGHSPSGSDVQTGRPYSGPAGELLEELLAEAGIERSELYITNLVKCWTWKEENGLRVNRIPSAKEIKDWVPAWLRPELELIKPRAIVCLGGPTAQHFLGKGFKITLQGGQWLELPEDSPYLKLTGHHFDPRPFVMGIAQPNYLTHLQEHAPESYPAARSNLVADLLKVRRALEGKLPEAQPPEQGELDIPF